MLTINLTGHEMVKPKPMSSDGIWLIKSTLNAWILVGFLMLLDDLALDLRSVAIALGWGSNLVSPNQQLNYPLVN